MHVLTSINTGLSVATLTDLRRSQRDESDMLNTIAPLRDLKQ